MKVYIVLYNGNVSSEGYTTEEKAIEFIEGRFGKPKKVDKKGWLWRDMDGSEYKIKEINIR